MKTSSGNIDYRLTKIAADAVAELPDWKRVGVPVLRPSDFLARCGPLLKLGQFGRLIIRQYQMRVRRLPEALIRCFGFKLIIPLQGGIGYQLVRDGFRELDQRYVITKVLRPGMTVLDLGGNIGYYVAMYGNLMSKIGRIYAVEPDPRSIAYLRRNIELNGLRDIATVDAVALADYTGIAFFNLAGSPNLSGLSHSALPRRYDGRHEVQVRDFGAYLSSIPHTVDLMRMDIEGHEVEILRSLVRRAEEEGTIGWAPRLILFEGHVWEYTRGNGNRMLPLVRRLFELGYGARYLVTASEYYSALRPRGYLPEVVIDAGHRFHGVYANVRLEDAIELIATEPSLTTICIERTE